MKSSPVPANASVGIVLATHGSSPYIHVSLECLRRHEPDVRVLLHDDSSDEEGRLRELAHEYGADFHTTGYRMKPTLGDLSGFSQGLQWAAREEIDVVVKCSRSFIANRPWSRELVNLLAGTGYVTASSYCAHFGSNGFGFRTEWVGMHVKSWIDSGIMQQMQGYVDTNTEYGFPEAFGHNKAREVHQFVHPISNPYMDSSNPDCDYTVRADQFFPRPQNYDSFAIFFGLLGIARTQRRDNVYWHDSHPNCQDYGELARSLGLDYADEAFQRVPGE
jgi:hypothetical protein